MEWNNGPSDWGLAKEAIATSALRTQPYMYISERSGGAKRYLSDKTLMPARWMCRSTDTLPIVDFLSLKPAAYNALKT